MHTINLTSTSFTNPIIDGINGVLPKLPSVSLVLLIGILLIRILVRLVRFVLLLTNSQIGIRNVVASVIEIFLWIFLSIKVLESLGFANIIVFFTGSVAAVGIAMAAGGSTLISDIVAGLFLAQDNDFNVGDIVSVGETPTVGRIVSMDARRTRLIDKEGVLHIIPNSLVERKEWVLIERSHTSRALVHAAKKLGRVAKEAKAVAREHSGVRQVRHRDGS